MTKSVTSAVIGGVLAGVLVLAGTSALGSGGEKPETNPTNVNYGDQ